MTVYAIKQSDPSGSWIQEFPSLEAALRYRGNYVGVLVKRVEIDVEPGLWWVPCSD